MYSERFLEKSKTYEHLPETEFTQNFLKHINGSIMKKLKRNPGIRWATESYFGATHAPLCRFQAKCEELDQRLLEELQAKSSSSSYQEMQKVRQKLPSMQMRQQILDLIEKNQITVISGETGACWSFGYWFTQSDRSLTGCGKTTQVSQFILDDFIAKSKGSECKIICTQPRRISAIAVAERVACERDETLGNSVGFQIRLEKYAPFMVLHGLIPVSTF